MQVVATATLSPGTCALCDSAAGPFVDTARTSRFGRVYVCRVCSRDVARVFTTAFAKPEPTAAAKADLEAELVALRERFGELVKAVNLTLTEGAVIRRGKIALRSQRGQQGFDLHVGP